MRGDNRMRDVKIKIALTGKMRSGKDTVGRYAVEKYGMVRFAFGDGLKRNFHKEYPHIPKDPKPVRGYQLYGQLMRYVKDENIWVDECFKSINYTKKVADDYRKYFNEETTTPFMPVITDLRQPNEYERCVAEGFTIIRVHCPNKIRLERIQTTGDNVSMEDLDFETEKHVDGFKVDYEIDNSVSLQDLYAQFAEIMEELRSE